MSTKRRNRSNSARSPRSRGAERSIAAEGVYNNSPFVSAVAGLIGNVFKVYTVSGKVYEGILTTFSSQFEIAMELPHKVDPDSPHSIDAESVVDKMVFKAQDVVKLKVTNADLDYALKDAFQTDTAISKFNGQVQEKELEPWDGSTSGNIDDDFDLSGTTSNGWNVNEMFRQNEQKYGVTTTFDQGLAGYTTPLQKDAKDYKDAEAKAIKIAKEIESNPHYKTRIELENGDEEEKFAAVVRPGSTNSGSSDGNNTRYVCPPRRKTIQSSNKGPRPPSSLPTQPQQQGGLSSLSPKGSSPSSTGYSQQSSEPNSNPPSGIRSERANGSAESPKPQRLNVAPRHNRTFANSEGPKHSHNGGGSTPSAASGNNNATVAPMTATKNTDASSQSPAGPPSSREQEKAGATVVQQHTTQPSHHSHYSSHVVHSLPLSSPTGSLQMSKAPAGNVGANEGQPHGPRKPPAPPTAAAIEHPVNAQYLNQRKKSRGKDEQMADLKKFSKDFKLETPEEPTNKLSGPESMAIPAVAAVQSVAKSNSPPSPQEETPKPLKSKLNPNAKEFNPSPKPFAARTASTPNQSRPHTPQTPGYGPPLPPMPMVMPAYVVTTAQPSFSQPPNPAARYRKLQVGMSANPQVASVTGQPLLAPAPLPQFTVPYSPQAHVPPQSYQQMVRMVAQPSGGVAPPMLTTITYPPDGSGQGQVPYAGPPPQAPPHPPHYPPHVHQHQPPHNASSPQAGKNSQMGGNNNMGSGSSGGGANHNGGGHNNTGGPPPPHSQAGYPTSSGAPSYSQQSLPGPPHAFPTTIMYPIFQAPPPYPTGQPPHHLMTAQPSVQQYVHHQHSHQHSSGVGSPQPHHIQVLLPHNH